MAEQVYKVEVTMTVKKTYTVKASDDDEAIQKLMESGIVSVEHEDDRSEGYDEDYDVLETVSEEEEVDVE